MIRELDEALRMMKFLGLANSEVRPLYCFFLAALPEAAQRKHRDCWFEAEARRFSLHAWDQGYYSAGTYADVYKTLHATDSAAAPFLMALHRDLFAQTREKMTLVDDAEAAAARDQRIDARVQTLLTGEAA